VLKLLIQTTGWLVAHTPECILRGATLALAELVFALRRRVILSNLHHAFSEKSERERRKIGRASCRQMIETALLSLATPYLPLTRLRKIVTTTPEMNALVAAQRETPRPHVLVTPHFAYWEAVTCFPISAPLEPKNENRDTTVGGRTTAGATTPLPIERFPTFSAIYRPMNNPELDAWLKSTRERFGIKLLSRRKGFQDAIGILRRGGAVSILYDQNAGDVGALTTLLGRVCATTELPGILAQKFSAPVVAVYARRLGFWRIAVHAESVIAAGAASEDVTRGLNRWLEAKLRSDARARDSWLWAHARWKNQDKPDRRLRLEAKRNLLTEEDIRLTNGEREEVDAPPTSGAPKWKRTQSSTRIWVRLPNWLGDVVMLLPLLRALRASRPDAEITLIGKAAFAPLIEVLSLGDGVDAEGTNDVSAPLAEHANTRIAAKANAPFADRFIPLPPRSGLLGELRYFAQFWRLRRSYPDCILLFTNSTRGDLEAFLTRASQRFGIARPGKPRPLLTHRYALPPDYDEAQHHQLDLWRDFLKHFGLEMPPNLSPFLTAHQRVRRQIKEPPAPPLGLICGSENFPAKRWPIPHWVTLIDALPRELPIRLFGTEKDRELTDQIAALAQRPVENLAGKTDLRAYCAALRECAALVTNDTGGMHLANALGVPLIALFGPTNPVRTGPVFDAPVTILQPPRLAHPSPENCPPTGGGNLDALAPEAVMRSVTAAIHARATDSAASCSTVPNGHGQSIYLV